ncbi:hypothetical protein ABFP33_02895 [Acinetobacter bereziniae]|uniref:hypothetical protein n=1 Tax=Acinetobacter bereziniae TaxID=106648 RepID=UPI003212C8ED
MSKVSISFTSGCAINADNYYLSANIDEYDAWEEFTKTLIYKHRQTQKWQELDLEGWKVISVAYQNINNQDAVICLDKEGDVGVFKENNNEHQVIREKQENKIYGQFNQIRIINNNLYVCGSGGQVYKNNQTNWEPLGYNFEENPLEILPNDLSFLEYDVDFGFNKNLYDINGFDENNIYVCGTKNGDGFIAFFDGTSWIEIDRITPSALSGICLCPDNKNVLISGDYGTLLKGNVIDGFENLKDISINHAFYNSAYYKKNLYIASENGLYIYDDGKFCLVPELNDLKGVISIEVKEGVLWVLSYKKLIRYNGFSWEVIDYIDNNKTVNDSGISMKSGEQCPKSGYWFTVAKENSRQYFKQGEILPDVKSDWGDVYWQFDGEK